MSKFRTLATCRKCLDERDQLGPMALSRTSERLLGTRNLQNTGNIKKTAPKRMNNIKHYFNKTLFGSDRTVAVHAFILEIIGFRSGVVDVFDHVRRCTSQLSSLLLTFRDSASAQFEATSRSLKMSPTSYTETSGSPHETSQNT